jgi:hypothetical protein
MLRTLAISIMVSLVIVFVLPHTREDAARLAVRTGVALINFGVALYPERSIDVEDEHSDAQDARLSSGVTHAQFDRQGGVPYRPGCEMLGCREMWDHDMGRAFRRCSWRCPRPAAPPPIERAPSLPSHDYEVAPERVPVSGRAVPAPIIFLGLIAVIAIVIGVALSASDASAIDIEKVLDETDQAAAARARLAAAIAQADAIIAEQPGRAFERGRWSDGDG